LPARGAVPLMRKLSAIAQQLSRGPGHCNHVRAFFSRYSQVQPHPKNWYRVRALARKVVMHDCKFD
jgi:hypothetical protein